MKKELLLILMFISMTFWGLAWINAKILSNYLDTYNLIFWRFLFATISLVPVIILLKQSFKITFYNLCLAFFSAILLIIYNYFFFSGTKIGNAGFGGVLVTTINPVLTFFIVALITLKKLGKIEIFALFLATLGVVIMLKIWQFGVDIWFDNGIKYFLLAALMWVFITIASSKTKNISPLTFSIYMYAFTTILNAIFILKGVISPILNFDFIFWLNFIAVSILAVSVATTIYFMATAKMGSKWASGFIFLVPFSAAIFAWLFLEEKLEITTIIGGVIVMFSVYILQRAVK